MLSVLIIGFGVYYFVHVQQKTAYFAARNLRILGTVSTQILDRLQTPEAAVGAPSPPRQLVWNPDSNAFEKEAQKAEPQRITIDQIVRQVFEQSFVDVFDAVVIADHEGNVRWQRPHNVSTMTRLDELTTVTGIAQKEGKLATADLKQRAHTASVMLEGREYRLFSQPLPMKMRDGKPNHWVIAGIISNSRFAADSVTVSYTLLIAVLAVFLLIIFSLPFLKLRLLGELQRVRVSDIIMLGVALLCAVAVVTLICLDTIAYRHTRDAADEQLRQLSSDIKRHTESEIALAYNVLSALDANLQGSDCTLAPVPPDIRLLPAVSAYPFFESFSRIDSGGVQRRKWYMGRQVELIPVSDRRYFRDALRGHMWQTSSDGRYVLEAIRSRTTGVTQAVIAKRSSNGASPDNPVVALAFPMLSLIDTVIAADARFVIIDDEGRVVFHSESQRNNVENFFVETDRDRTLRAVVAGRQDEMVNLRYWGEDQRAFVTPVDGTPWTMVTFRSKRLLRTLNVETIMIAVMLLLIHALGYAIFGALVALGRPFYRAPWLWPDHGRGADYLCLITSYVALGVAFATSIYLFRPRVVLVIAAMMPALALLMTYLRLRRARGVTAAVAATLATATVVILVACTLFGQVETDTLQPKWIVQAFILAMLAVAILTARFSPATEKMDSESRLIMPGYSYVIGAAALLVLSAVLPTAALYKAAYKIEMESFVKHGQLQLVRDLEESMKRIGDAVVDGKYDPTVRERLEKSNLGVYYRFFFDTEVFKRPATATYDTFMAGLTGMEAPPDRRNPVPRFVEWLLPQYSDHSIRMRELLHSSSADERWRWRRRGNQLDFHSDSLSGQKLVTVSEMPRLLPRLRDDSGKAISLETLIARGELETLIARDEPRPVSEAWDKDPITDVTRGLLIFTLLAGYVSVIMYGAYFVSRKVFLVDVRDPLWLDRTARIGPALGGNMLIFAPDLESALKIVDRRQFINVSLADFDGKDVDVTAVWNRELTRVDREPVGKGILIPDFDRGTGDRDFMELKLRLLESAINVHTRTVVAITQLSPWVLMDAVARHSELAERWRALLATFNVRIQEDEQAVIPEAADTRTTPQETKLVVLSPKHWLPRFIDRTAARRSINGSPEHAHALIERETAQGGPFLQQLGRDLRDKIRGREEIYDEIGERASMYYASLWATCTNAEKTVLMHIAADGFANSKDRHTIRRLLARGLIRRAPNFKVMNETFRRFVVADAQKREVAVFYRSDVPESTWDKIQKPLMVGLVIGGGFFFFTQRELFDSTFAIVSGVAGGIPAVLRLVGILTSPKDAMAAVRG